MRHEYFPRDLQDLDQDINQLLDSLWWDLVFVDGTRRCLRGVPLDSGLGNRQASLCNRRNPGQHIVFQWGLRISSWHLMAVKVPLVSTWRWVQPPKEKPSKLSLTPCQTCHAAGCYRTFSMAFWGLWQCSSPLHKGADWLGCCPSMAYSKSHDVLACLLLSPPCSLC